MKIPSLAQFYTFYFLACTTHCQWTWVLIFNKKFLFVSQVVRVGLWVTLAVMSLIALVLSIIAISEQRAMAKSLHKDRLAQLQNKPEQHFQRLTTKVTDKNIVKNHLSQDQDINQLKRTVEENLEEIKTKVSSKFKELKKFFNYLEISYSD